MDAAPATSAIPAALLPQEQHFAVYGLTEGLVPYGFYAGTPAVILRLQGCPVGCPWCDQPSGIPEPTLGPAWQQASEEDLERSGYRGWRWVSTTRLLALIDAHASRHVLITGGEPALYDLAWFSEQLVARGYTVQVETSGVLPLSIARQAWVTLSPKPDAHPELTVWPWLYKRADEVVQLIRGPADEQWVDRTLKSRRLGSIVWLLPLDGRPDLGELCWELARRHCLRCCIQMPQVAPMVRQPDLTCS